MKELTVHTHYDMLHSPKRNHSLPSKAMIAVSSVFFGCGMLLGRMSDNSIGQNTTSVMVMSGERVIPSNNTRGDDGRGEKNGTKLAWMLSFPNSGTSFTSQLVRAVTGSNTATNYGLYNLLPDSTSERVYESSPGGPFWTDPKMNDTKPENGYILTKTHCGGYCDACGPEGSVLNQHLFLRQCLATSYVSREDDNGELIHSKGSYDTKLVGRAVHLIRDPFDNIVSRFHLRHNRFTKLNDTESLAKYPKSKEGFRAFCRDLSDRYATEEERSKFYVDVIDTIRNVPCHGDFFRYIQWHNLAFVTVWDLAIPSLVIHYENYTDNFNETVDVLIDFLGRDVEGVPPVFFSGKTYRHYFTDGEIGAIADVFERLALDKTWYHTRHYFG